MKKYQELFKKIFYPAAPRHADFGLWRKSYSSLMGPFEHCVVARIGDDDSVDDPNHGGMSADDGQGRAKRLVSVNVAALKIVGAITKKEASRKFTQAALVVDRISDFVYWFHWYL